MIITKKAISRRTVLRGLGASVALPFLDGMVPAFAALRTTAASPVRRLGVVYVPNGMMMPHWTPQTEGSGFDFPTILKPLEPFRSQIQVLSGMHGVESEGPHARSSTRFLTGMPSKPDDGSDLRGGVSMDQIAGRVHGRETQLATLELALDGRDFAGSCDDGFSCAYTNTIAWANDTTPLPMENNPRVVFERLFGDGGTREQRLTEMRKDRSILDSVSDDLAHLERELGFGDRQRVNQYLDAVRAIERRIQFSEAQGADSALPENLARPAGIPDSYEEHVALMYDLVALAFQTDLTRVFTFMVGRELGGRPYPQIGVPDPHHGLSHHRNDPEKLAKLAKINKHHVELFSHFLKQLNETSDGDGTLLDSSLVLYGAGLGDSNDHLHYDLPATVVGGRGTGWRGGRHLKYPKDTPMANLLVSMLDKAGLPAEKFGDSTGRLTALTDI